MKIKKIKKYQSRLLRLQILKLYYKKKSQNSETTVKQIELYLNKISHVIYNYHINNKKILFIGFPKNFKKNLKQTKHSFIPECQWLNGMLSNRNYNNKQKKVPNNLIKLFLKLKKKIDLIIIYDLNKESTAIEEAYIARTPVINLTTKLKITNAFSTYEFPGNFFNINHQKHTNNNIFFSVIQIALEKAKNIIKKRPSSQKK